MRRTKSGNVFFIILIAIAMFAALSLAVTNSSGTNDGGLSEQRANLYADQIMAYAKNVEQAVSRMLARGVSENDLCFDVDADYPAGDTRYEHDGCADTANMVFHSSGGGVRYKDLDTAWLDSSFSGGVRYGELVINGGNIVAYVGTQGPDPENADLAFYIPYVKLDICKAVNRKANGTEDITIEGGSAQHGYYTGTFASWHFTTENGEKTGCNQIDSSSTKYEPDSYIFYHVLHAR